MKVLKSKTSLGIFTVLMAAAVGVWFSAQSWNGITYYFLGDSRQPAAVRKSLDLSNLEGSALQLASQKRILEEAKVISTDHGIGIELGHFILRGEDGKKQFGCHVYDHIQLVFYADGVAADGNVPMMSVEGACKMQTDINRISAIQIPTHKILQEKPGDLELSYLEDTPVFIHFDHVVDKWPREWTLFSVKLFSQNNPNRSIKELFIDHSQVQASTQKPLKLSWTKEDLK